jgi:hypothetical protein
MIYFYSYDGVRLCLLELRLLTGPFFIPQMLHEWIWSSGGIILTGENRRAGSWFCPTFTISTDYSFSAWRVTEIWTGKKYERKLSWPNLRSCTGIFLEVGLLRKTTKDLSQDSRPQRRRLNLESLEYEAGVDINTFDWKSLMPNLINTA